MVVKPLSDHKQNQSFEGFELLRSINDNMMIISDC